MGKAALVSILALGTLLVAALHHRGRMLEERRKRSVRLEAAFSAERGKAGRPLPVKFVLRNVGHEPREVVTRQEVAGGADFTVHVQDSAGDWWWRKGTVFFRETVKHSDFIRLGPGNSVEIRDQVFESWRFPAGRFRLVAHFRFEPRHRTRETIPLELIQEWEVEVDP